MQCLRIWITIGLCAYISVNDLLANPVDPLPKVDGNGRVADLSTAESNNQDGAEISERDNEVGYLRKSNEKGGDGYQHFESFHDKDGDAYGYEKHEAYGKSNKGESLNDEKDKEEGSHYTYIQELGDKPKYQKYHSISDDPGKNHHSNYHYSYNSDDDENDDKQKPKHSSSYTADATKDDGSEDDDEESGGDEEADGEEDEEKSTNFSYKIYSEDYADEEGNEHGDVNSKGNGNGYHFGDGNKNTNVDYSKKSDYVASFDDESEDEDDGNSSDNNEQEKDKDTKSYSTYTTFSSQEGDEEDEDADEETPEKPVRYERPHPTKVANIQQVTEESNDDDEYVEEEEVKQAVIQTTPFAPVVIVHVEPTKQNVLIKEHRSGYVEPTKQNVLIKEHRSGYVEATKPNVVIKEHRSGYKIEEKSGDDQASDDGGKGHAGSVSKHLYEIYVTHDTGKAKAGGDDGNGDSGNGDDGKGKSESLVLQQLKKPKKNTSEQDNGGYKVNINFGQKPSSPKKNGKKSSGKQKAILKKKKQQIIKPHTYEVEEYIENEDAKKSHIKPGQGSAPLHHKDSGDYSYGQQFIYASEADSDAYY